ncbi:hypothetical protein GOM49_12930 [Clostridium bovifaecis]|uniref:Glycosyltransferase 2-like domain-containing protein n=1 Tax=Clostridium bovifaecis TaxID=2184719 RepID=A0A6I6EU43_9CLOT|nr:hypothetical protein GOM49_12930 [Clostridium bovifaecis]
MNRYMYIGLSGIALLIAGFLIYKKIKAQVIDFKAEKITPRVSLVLVVKNNEKILRYAMSRMLRERKDIEEILIMDLGSIDSTLDIIREFMEKDLRVKFLKITHRTITENYFSIIRGQVHGESILVLDLYKLGTENPNVYVPDLFKPLNQVLVKEVPKSDSRIDGSKLLYLDEHERKKNSYVIKEYIVDPIYKIHSSMEKLLGEIKEEDSSLREQTIDVQQYLHRTMKDLNMLLHLISPIENIEGNLDENIIDMFKIYGEEHRISVKCKVLGSRKEFKDSINILILEVIQDLLYTVIQYNLSSNIEVFERYGNRHYNLLFKYDCICDEKALLSPESGLSYYVLHSIQNRLSLVGGKMRIRIKPQWKVNIFIQLPMESATLLKN